MHSQAVLMIGISSTWMATKGFGIRESIERCFALGFGLVEVGAGHKYEPDAAETAIEAKRRHPDRQFTLHSLFPPQKESYVMNLADKDEHARTMSAADGMFELARRIDADVVGLHGGYCGKVEWTRIPGPDGFRQLVTKSRIERRAAISNVHAIIGRLVAEAEDRRVRLAVENSPDGTWSPVPNTPDEFEELFSAFPSESLGVLLDLGHLHRTAAANGFDPYDFTERFKDRIFELHLHDVVDGEDHHAVGTGEVGFARHFDIIGRKRLEVMPLVFEYTNLVSEEAALRGKALVERMISSL
jgi:sugar phosphate isomerase/epimerase